MSVTLDPTSRGLNELIASLTSPAAGDALTPAAISSPAGYRDYLSRGHARTNGQATAGFPGTVTESAYARFLGLRFNTSRVYVWRDEIVVGAARYKTPAWVGALLALELPYKPTSFRAFPQNFALALRMLDDAVRTLAPSSDGEAEGGEGDRHEHALAR